MLNPSITQRSKKLASLFSLVAADFITVFVCFWISFHIRNGILPDIFPGLIKIPGAWHYFADNSYVIIIWIIIFAHERLYTKRFTYWQEVRILVKSSTISFAVILIMIFVTKTQTQFSRPVVIFAWLLSLILFPVSRYLTKLILAQTHLWKKKLIILGVHETSLMVLKSIKNNKTMGYEVLGFLDDDPNKIGKRFLGVKVLGPLSQLEPISNSLQSKDIIIATPHMPRRKLKELLTECDNISDSMWLIPRTGDFVTEGVEIEVLGEVLTLSIKKNLSKPWNIFIKSFFERCTTIFLIIILSPIFALIAIAIKLDSKGPVFFKQKRLGQRKQMFEVIKFRSMHVNTEKKLEKYLDTHPEAKEEWKKYKKLKNHDPRVTRVGRIIRRFSMDELPQLFNVIIGHMSLVGPRPYLIEELHGKDAFISMITRVKPGITGLWQISGRSEVPFEKRITFDEYYIRNWSLWLDIIILLKSLKVLFSSKGAY